MKINYIHLLQDIIENKLETPVMLRDYTVLTFEDIFQNAVKHSIESLLPSVFPVSDDLPHDADGGS